MFRILSLVITVAVVTCPAFPASAEDQFLKIGVITTLTGKMSTIGTAVKNGIELARSERPEAFSNVSFIYQDDRFDAKQAIAAFQKLKDVDQVSILFGFGDTLGIVIGRLAERAEIPFINFNFDASSAVGKQFVVRSLNHTQQYMNALAEYLQRKGSSKFYIVRSESPFFNAMVDSFKASVSGRNLVEEIGVVNPDENDFRAVILKLLTKAPGPVGLFLGPDQLISFSKQARDLHLVTIYFGADLFETAAGIGTEVDLFSGALYPDNNVSKEFRSHYRKTFRNESQLTFAGSAYDMANLVSESRGASDFMKRIESVKNRSGVLQDYSFKNDPKFGKYFEYHIRVKKISGKVGLPVD